MGAALTSMALSQYPSPSSSQPSRDGPAARPGRAALPLGTRRPAERALVTQRDTRAEATLGVREAWAAPPRVRRLAHRRAQRLVAALFARAAAVGAAARQRDERHAAQDEDPPTGPGDRRGHGSPRNGGPRSARASCAWCGGCGRWRRRPTGARSRRSAASSGRCRWAGARRRCARRATRARARRSARRVGRAMRWVGEHEVAALDVGGRRGEALAAQGLAQRGHLELAVAADVHRPQERDEHRRPRARTGRRRGQACGSARKRPVAASWRWTSMPTTSPDITERTR